MSSADEAEAALMRLARTRPSVKQLWYPSLESEVVGEYMAHRRRHHKDDAWIQLVYGMVTSRTLYVGNLSFYTREEQVHELFARVGRVARVIMGLNANTRTPCGFAFVEFATSVEAAAAHACLSGTMLDGRVIRADLDQEFEEGRQYGRSKTGGQLQDDYRADFDAGRGGWGAAQQARQERIEAAARHALAQHDTFGDEGQAEDNPFDPTETIDRERHDEEDRTAMKLSAFTVAALTEGVFPHYALPIDERTRQALTIAQGGPAAAAAVAAAAAAAASAAQPVAAMDVKRTVSPAAALPASPPHKRTRQHSRTPSPPRALSPATFAATSPPHAAAAAASSGSPQPLASCFPAPRSPGPRSPAPLSPGASGDGWGTPERGYTPDHLSDGDRTPSPRARSPPYSPAPRNANDRAAGLAHDDATPPPSSRSHRSAADDDGDERMSLGHDDATPPPPAHSHSHAELDDDAQTPRRDDHADGAHDHPHEIDDDMATPPPPADRDGDEAAEAQRRAQQQHADPTQPSFDEFER